MAFIVTDYVVCFFIVLQVIVIHLVDFRMLTGVQVLKRIKLIYHLIFYFECDHASAISPLLRDQEKLFFEHFISG